MLTCIAFRIIKHRRLISHSISISLHSYALLITAFQCNAKYTSFEHVYQSYWWAGEWKLKKKKPRNWMDDLLWFIHSINNKFALIAGNWGRERCSMVYGIRVFIAFSTGVQRVKSFPQIFQSFENSIRCAGLQATFSPKVGMSRQWNMLITAVCWELELPINFMTCTDFILVYKTFFPIFYRFVRVWSWIWVAAV